MAIQKRFIISIDLGGTNLKIGLLDLKYKIKEKRILNTQSLFKKGDLIQAIINSTNKIIKNNTANPTTAAQKFPKV